MKNKNKSDGCPRALWWHSKYQSFIHFRGILKAFAKKQDPCVQFKHFDKSPPQSPDIPSNVLPSNL